MKKKVELPRKRAKGTSNEMKENKKASTPRKQVEIKMVSGRQK